MPDSFLQRAARRVVSGYPQPWRDRYESELLALLEDSPARVHDVVDLARGQVVERVRSLFEPGERPTLLATAVFVAGLARALAITLPPILAGLAVQYSLGPAPRTVARFAILGPLLYVVLIIVVRFARNDSANSTPVGPRKPLFSEHARLLYVGTASIPIAFLMSWSSENILQAFNPLWMFAPVWHQLSAQRPWQVEMARAVAQMRAARHQLKWALMELERCEALVAAGVPAPIETAREVIARLEREEEDALATLHGLGYRATLHPRTRTGTPEPEPEPPNPEPNLNTN